MNNSSFIINHRNGKYPIFITDRILSREDAINPFIHGTQVLIICDQNTAKHYLKVNSIKNICENFQTEILVLKPGEKTKSLKNFQKITDHLANNNYHRDSTLIALGGGVIGDLTGFIASCYMRGINYIQIPTTLLAQVDSSIGGKTAINHPQGKNLIGAFYPPAAVFIDTSTLETLPTKQYNAAIAEIIKAALIHQDDRFFTWLESNIMLLINKDKFVLDYAIKKACEIKKIFTEKDERENNVRAYLNLGHTFGHATEKYFNFNNWQHGEAVAYGILMAAYISTKHLNFQQKDFERILLLLKDCDILRKLPNRTDFKDLTKAMLHDKKIKLGNLQLVLLSEIGKPVITNDIAQDAINLAWNAVNALP